MSDAVFTERRKQMSSQGDKLALSHPQGPHGDGRVSPRGHAVFSQLVSRDLHGAVPGNYTLVRPQSLSSRSLKRTSFNERAKSGFKYWYQERPHPTKCGLCLNSVMITGIACTDSSHSSEVIMLILSERIYSWCKSIKLYSYIHLPRSGTVESDSTAGCEDWLQHSQWFM